MAWRCGSLSRSLISTVRASSLRSPPPLLRLRPLSRHMSPTTRNLGQLGCIQSMLPLYNVMASPRLTSHLAVNVRACCELNHGTFRRTCQDR